MLLCLSVSQNVSIYNSVSQCVPVCVSVDPRSWCLSVLQCLIFPWVFKPVLESNVTNCNILMSCLNQTSNFTNNTLFKIPYFHLWCLIRKPQGFLKSVGKRLTGMVYVRGGEATYWLMLNAVWGPCQLWCFWLGRMSQCKHCVHYWKWKSLCL